MERQIEFLQRLEQNLLALEEKRNMKPLKENKSFPRTSTVLYSHPNLLKGIEVKVVSNFGEDLEEGKPEGEQCRINYENYSRNCLIGWKQDLKHLALRKNEFRKGGIQFYPKNFVKLFEVFKFKK